MPMIVRIVAYLASVAVPGLLLFALIVGTIGACSEAEKAPLEYRCYEIQNPDSGEIFHVTGVKAYYGEYRKGLHVISINRDGKEFVAANFTSWIYLNDTAGKCE